MGTGGALAPLDKCPPRFQEDIASTALSAVNPWSSFQCLGIHHAARARTYKGDEHLAYALYKSMAPLVLYLSLMKNELARRRSGGH